MSILKKLIIACLCIGAVSASAYAESEVLPITEDTTVLSTVADIPDVYFNDVKTDISVITTDNKPMVSINQICDLLDLGIEHYKDSDCYILKNQFTTLVLYMNNPYTIVNEGGYYTAVAPKTVDDTAYVSLDVVTEAFGATLDSTDNKISINYNSPVKNIVFNNQDIALKNHGIIHDGKLMLSVNELADILQISKVDYYSDSDCYVLKNQFTTLVLYMNNPYTIVNDSGYYTAVAPKTINNTAYVSLDVVTEAFGAMLNLTDDEIKISYSFPVKSIIYNNQDITLKNHGVVRDGKLMLSVNELAEILQISNVTYYSDSDCYVLNNGINNLCIYMNNPYTIIGDYGYYTSVSPTYINNIPYVSADVILEAFNAKSIMSTTLNIEYFPPVTAVTFNGKKVTLKTPGVVTNGKLMIPINAMKDMMRLSCEYYSDNNCYVIKDRKRTQTLTVYMNNPYTIVGNDSYYTAVAPTYINGTAYVSADVILEAFNTKHTISEKNNIYSLSFNYNPYTWEESFVINAGKSSSTNYLIWVSKSNFRVYIFTGSKGDWRLLTSYPCSIGAPSTPTCEGTYKFYERVPLWDYGSYYVGPVMRFNGGYALHSTLEYYGGGSYDGRLGYMISHGCVRLAPAAIKWMYNNIPLYTTVYITG